MAPERLSEPNWTALAGVYPAKLVEGLRDTLERGDVPLIDPALLGLSVESDLATTMRLLDEVARLGHLAIEEHKLCGNCITRVNPEDEAAGICSQCTRHYAELDIPFTFKRVFKRPAGRESRDISWVVTVHGMNSDGPWQQDFSWLIANKLKYSAPVLILKYPILRVMTLFERTQRLLAADLGKRLQNAIAHTHQRAGEVTDTPDVVLHSYGTLLFSRLLLDPRFESLKFGRVILAGAIVRPDYDWAQHIASGRIEAVVNHCGDRDRIVHLAQYAMPGSGPSGRVGFLDPIVRNVRAENYGHSTFFDIEPMKANLAPGGAWDRFLTYPADQLAGQDEMARPAAWSPDWSAMFVRPLAKLLALAGLGPLFWFGMQLVSAIKAVVHAK